MPQGPPIQLAWRRLAPAASLLALALSACGGGGSDDAATTPAAAAPATSQLTATNAAPAAAQAYKAASALYSSGSTAAISIKDGSVQNTGIRFSLAEFATKRLIALTARPAATPQVSTKALASDSATCPGGGEFSVSRNDADNSGTLTTGDSGSFLFTNCVIYGVTLSGGFSFSGLVVTGSASTASQSVGATFVFTNFRGTQGADSATVDGDFSIQASVTNVGPQLLDVTVTGRNLTVSENASTASLSGFSARLLIDDTAGTFAYSVQGTAAGTGLPGPIALSNPTPLSGRIGTFPSAGVLLVRTTDSGSARVTANSSTNVTVELDANGDGAYEFSETRTWSQLVAAANGL